MRTPQSGNGVINSRETRVDTRLRIHSFGRQIAALATCLSAILVGVLASDAAAKDSRVEASNRALLSGETAFDGPTAQRSFLRADTLSFGSVDVDGYAVVGGIWDFDTDAAGDPLQGWYAIDVTAQTEAYFRQITDGAWGSGENLVDAPVLNGVGSAWVGAYQNQGDALCWQAGLGYGTNWCQRLISPALEYSGSGNISLDMLYFNDTELDYDYTKVILRRLPSNEETSLNFDGFTDQIGLAVNHPDDPPVGANFMDIINAADLQGETQFQIIFEMKSDGGYDDEDGSYSTEYGPFAADDVELSGALVGGDVAYDFEAGLNGWTAAVCPGNGTFMGVAELANYTIEDPCSCELSGNVMEFHNEDFEHSYGDENECRSSPVDVANDVIPNLGGDGALKIFADWNQYSVLPQANGTHYRPGFDYYPFTCEQTGDVSWSGRVGQATWYYLTGGAICADHQNVATDNGVPADIEQIRFVYEMISSCDAFGIPPEECTNITNFTPIIDNIELKFTREIAAPPVSFDPGTQYQDGFSQALILDPDVAGRADITENVNFGNEPPFVLGDSLFITGPVPTAETSWEARLWFRVRNEGPQGPSHAEYTTWRDQYGGPSIVGENADFAWAYMDSFQLGTLTAKNKFVSFLREDDPHFDSGAGEYAEVNEIIRDNVLYPGTAIDYFISSNYAATPNVFFTLPDTTGSFFLEFEILPSWRDDEGTLKFPCILYVDAYNAGAQFFIENALDVLGLEHDRYDYLDASSNWKAPMARGGELSSNNGVPLPQLLGYRGVLLNTGLSSGGLMWPQDWVLFSDWLDAVACDGNAQMQGFIANGDNLATAMTLNGSSFLSSYLGATQSAMSYYDVGADENYCVQLESPIVGAAYGTTNSFGDYDYDAWGNWCPQQYDFDVLNTSGTGAGNRVYVNTGTFAETEWASVTNEVVGAENYRTVLDGVSWHHMSERDAVDECVSDSAHVVTAAFNEISAALEWVFGANPGDIPTFCENPCTVVDVDGTTGFEPTRGVTRLFQNSPNPFNPRTVLRFALSESGPVELAVFDVNGRLVRTLVDGAMEAGSHEIVWDGTDGNGNAVSSGVFWSQLTANGHNSNKKMVVLR